MQHRFSCRVFPLLTVVIFSLPIQSWACGLPGLPTFEELRQQLRSPAWDLNATAALYRLHGQQAVTHLCQLRDQAGPDVDVDIILALNELIDKVAAQRHASESRLFWYTDLQTAQQAAATSAKPILSLRLLGKLDEEFSCANSRFFRATLYPNTEISSILRDRFVLHWESVRPAPIVTVDFGDGRSLQRTVTGNSIHYVIDKDGLVLDALPGLYSSSHFNAWLDRILLLHTQVTQATRQSDKQELLMSYHEKQRRNILRQWQTDLSAINRQQPTNETTTVLQPTIARKSKSPQLDIKTLLARTDDTTWELIAANRTDGGLDAAAIRLIRVERPVAADAQRLSVSKSLAEAPVFDLVNNLQRSTQVDSIRNEYMLHRQLHEWFLEALRNPTMNDAKNATWKLDDLNTRVYAELFRSPLDDPWLGLLPADTYNALDNSGVRGQASVSAAFDSVLARSATN